MEQLFKKLNLPNIIKIDSVDSNAFMDSAVKEVQFNGNGTFVLSIGVAAFCKSELDTIVLPKGVTALPDFAFIECSYLKEIKLPLFCIFP